MAIENSKDWWEERYQSREWFYGKEPSKFLVENVERLKKGKTLDLGMGEGRNAVYLASKGHTVEGIDFSATAIERAENLARESGVSLKTTSKDIDMFLLPLMTFQNVILVDYKPSLRFLKDINRGIVQGGTIFIDCFTVAQLRQSNGPRPEMFECFKPNEVLHNLKNVHISFYREDEVEPNQHRVQCVATKTSLVG